MDEKEKRNQAIEIDLIELPDIPELKEDALSETQVDDGVIRLSNILDDLDKKMKSGKFLHTFTGQIEEINHMIKMKYASTKDIASIILKDVALSSRILSIVNSPYYGQFSQKGIASISDAMVILGTEEIQQAASALLLFEFMRDIAKSEMLKEKSLASLMRGMMAKEIATAAKYKAKDEFQIAAMLYDIGEQIILFCDPDAYQRIQRVSAAKGLESDIVSRKLLGASFGQIAQGIVSRWGFPSAVVDAIRPFKEFNMDSKLLTSDKLKRIVASFTNEMCNIDWNIADSQRHKNLETIVRRYGNFLDLGVSRADDLLNTTMDKIENHARILKINLKNSRFDRQSAINHQIEGGQGMNSEPSMIHGTSGHRAVVPLGDDDVDRIRQQIIKIEQLLDRQFKLSEVLHSIIATIYKGFFFTKISICIMNRKDGVMAARFVLGDDCERFTRQFKFSVAEDKDDVFNKALNTGVDVIVEDIHNRKIASRIPEWYVQGNFARAFSIYPLVIKQKKVGLLYVDWDESRTSLFSNEVKQFMRQLKMITIEAIKKSKK